MGTSFARWVEALPSLETNTTRIHLPDGWNKTTKEMMIVGCRTRED
jgi:hypothetical protein